VDKFLNSLMKSVMKQDDMGEDELEELVRSSDYCAHLSLSHAIFVKYSWQRQKNSMSDNTLKLRPKLTDRRVR